MITKQIVHHGKLITTDEREIHERRAVIKDNGDDTFTYWVYQDGVVYMHATWPPKGWPIDKENELGAVNMPEYRLFRLRDYIESVQFGGRVNIGWRKDDDTWLSDTLLGDSGGNGFSEAELELIRQSRKPATKGHTK